MKYLLPLLFIFGCGIQSLSQQIDFAANEHRRLQNTISLGDTKSKVLNTFDPSQSKIPANSMKPSDLYQKDGVNVEIYYMRTGRQPDGLTTDDEFTPYVFNDGKLVAIGWKTIGGVQTKGEAVPKNIQQTIVF